MSFPDNLRGLYCNILLLIPLYVWKEKGHKTVTDLNAVEINSEEMLLLYCNFGQPTLTLNAM